MITLAVVGIVLLVLLIALSQISLNIPRPAQFEQDGAWEKIDGQDFWFPTEGYVLVPRDVVE